MERWLVTGANGFLGSRIMKFYQGKYEITGAHHGNLDVTDEAAAAEFVRAAAPQLVIHCAAISNTGTCQENPGLSEAVNVNGAVNLARACRETGSRLIFMSSDQIYAGNRTMVPAKEENTPELVNVYGLHKRQSEEKIMAILPDSVCQRATATFWGIY